MAKDTFGEALRALLGETGVLQGDDGARYESDWRGKLRGQALCVARPASVDHVAGVLRLCTVHGVAVVPQGGNTGLCGGATPDATGRQMVLSLERLNRIRELDVQNNTATVEAGCVLSALRETARAQDRLFPLSLAAEGSSQVGGLVSTNAGGTAVLRYGNTRDLVLGLEVVLADGTVLSELSGLRKNNTGYDLKQLFIGAEGTLGVVTAATVKLFPRPRDVGTAWVALPDLPAAIALLRQLQDDWGDVVTSFEIASEEALALVSKHLPEVRRPFATRAPLYALVELSLGGKGARAEAALTGSLGEAAEAGRVMDAAVAQNEGQARQFWRLREEITECERREGPSVKHDVSVTLGRMPAFVAAAAEAVPARFPGTRVVLFGHLGDGSLHVNVLKGSATVSDADLFTLVHDLVVAHGGSFSAEHGVGALKRAELARYKSAAVVDVMRRVKGALDPLGLMNPGKVL